MTQSNPPSDDQTTKTVMMQTTLSEFTASTNTSRVRERTSQSCLSAYPDVFAASPVDVPCMQAASATIDGIHLLGCLHRTPSTVARVTLAVNLFDPDIIAVEACHDAIRQRHPDNAPPRLPIQNEVDLAVWLAWHRKQPYVTGIDSVSTVTTEEENERLATLDEEIFREYDWLGETERLTCENYRSLSLQQIQEWREESQARAPELFARVIEQRETVMGGRLQALRSADAVDDIVVAIGMQHLPGILKKLHDPAQIPDSDCEVPPVYRLNFLGQN